LDFQFGKVFHLSWSVMLATHTRGIQLEDTGLSLINLTTISASFLCSLCSIISIIGNYFVYVEDLSCLVNVTRSRRRDHITSIFGRRVQRTIFCALSFDNKVTLFFAMTFFDDLRQQENKLFRVVSLYIYIFFFTNRVITFPCSPLT